MLRKPWRGVAATMTALMVLAFLCATAACNSESTATSADSSTPLNPEATAFASPTTAAAQMPSPKASPATVIAKSVTSTPERGMTATTTTNLEQDTGPNSATRPSSTPTPGSEDEIYWQFSGKASVRSGSSRRENFYNTREIPLKAHHLEGGFLCYIFERTPDGPEYNGWPGWALYFSRERPNGNVSSSGLAYDQRNYGHRDCFAVGWGHVEDRPDRRSTSPRYSNYFRVERPEGSWTLTICTSRVDLTGKTFGRTSAGHRYEIGKRDFECPSYD